MQRKKIAYIIYVRKLSFVFLYKKNVRNKRKWIKF